MEYIVYLVLTPIAFAAILLAVIITWKYKDEGVGQSLLMFFTAIMVFMITNVFELIGKTEYWMLLWTKIQLTAYGAIAVFWVLFASRFSQIQLNYKFAFLGVIPGISAVLVWTYPLQKIFYTGSRIQVFKDFSTLDTDYGFFFWIFGAYSYFLLMIGAVLISRTLLTRGLFYKKLSVLILLGSITPLIANVLYILPLPIFRYKDFTPIAFALSGIFFFIGIYWHKFLEFIPIARSIIVEEMDQGIIILDKTDQIIDINRAALEILCQDTKLIGKKIQDVEGIWSFMQRSYKPEGCVFETLIHDGTSERNCTINVKPINLDQNPQNGVLITINDITLLVNLYDEKMRLIAQMEETYNKLNSTKLQLIHKEKLASIGQISAGMAHEIKNPLSFMQSNNRFLKKYIHQIADSIPQNRMSDLVSEIDDILYDYNDGLERILDVVNNLLNFSRNDTERKLDFNYDLNIGLDQALRILKGTIDPDIEVKKEYSVLPEISCYGSEINQVFLNLLNNAVHAVNNGNGGPKKIIIRTKSVSDVVIVEILNTGESIKPELRKKIFEPFFTTKTKNKGTGLGLSIVSDIVVKRHNGKVQVLEEDGMTLFRVTLLLDFDDIPEHLIGIDLPLSPR